MIERCITITTHTQVAREGRMCVLGPVCVGGAARVLTSVRTANPSSVVL